MGYVFFYDFSYYINNTERILQFWRGGMSFHGGFIGLLCAMFITAIITKKKFYDVSDFLAPLAPIGLGLGRIGNFINGELYGRPTDLPWGMIFRDRLAGRIPRHPSQLYEAFFEGLVLFVILWIYSSKPRPRMGASGLFLFGYGFFRFMCEFFRQPDAHLGFVAFGWMSMGQFLCLPMMLWGVVLLYLAHGREKKPGEALLEEV